MASMSSLEDLGQHWHILLIRKRLKFVLLLSIQISVTRLGEISPLWEYFQSREQFSEDYLVFDKFLNQFS